MLKYYNGVLLIRWNEDSFRAQFEANPPLSFSERRVMDFESDMIIIRDIGWKIYLDTSIGFVS